MKKCPVCEKGNLKDGSIDEEIFGVPLGTFKAEVCDRCGESFLNEDSMRSVEEKAKKAGIWGMAEKIKVVRSGNSLAIRIPAKIARFLGLKEGEEILVHPEGREKLVAEVV